MREEEEAPGREDVRERSIIRGLPVLGLEPSDADLARKPKGPPLSHAFARLPRPMVYRVGLRVKGQARGKAKEQVKVDLAVLSALAFFHFVNAGRVRTIGTDGWGVIALGPDVFLLSAWTIARNLAKRWGLFGDAVAVRKLYGRVNKALKRLEKAGLVARATGPEYEVFCRKRGRWGTVWTFTGTPLGRSGLYELRPVPPLPAVLLGATPEELVEAGWQFVDAVGQGYYEGVDPTEVYTHALWKAEVDTRWRAKAYTRVAAGYARRGDERERHHTVALFRRADARALARRWGADLTGRDAYVPFLILDVDPPRRPDRARSATAHRFAHLFKGVDLDAVEEAYRVARWIVGVLLLLGCDARTVLVVYTGGRGFHVRLPAGAFGNPVFRDATDVPAVLRAFARRVFGEAEGGVDEYAAHVQSGMIDESLFPSLHLVRAAGSYREATGLYARSFTAAEFLACPPSTSSMPRGPPPPAPG